MFFSPHQFLTTYRLFSVSKHTVIFIYWSSFRSSKVADTRESSPKRETSQVRREMPLNAGKPNRSSANGPAVGNNKHCRNWEVRDWQLESRGGACKSMTRSEQMWFADQYATLPLPHSYTKRLIILMKTQAPKFNFHKSVSISCLLSFFYSTITQFIGKSSPSSPKDNNKKRVVGFEYIYSM